MSDAAVEELARRGSDLLEAGDVIGALETLSRAEELAAGDPQVLCGVVGEKAVALRRVGNERGALGAYRQAIGACRSAGDSLNLSRWLGNSADLLRQRGDLAGASELLDELATAAAESGDPTAISVAAAVTATVLMEQGRFEEADARLEQAEERADADFLREIWRRNRISLLTSWAKRLREEHRLPEAAAAFEAAAELADTSDPEQAKTAARILAQLAQLHDLSGEHARARDRLREAEKLLREGGDDEAAAEIARTLAAPEAVRYAGGTSEADAFAEELEAALAAGDDDAALTARVNLAAALLATDSQRAFEEFDQALAESRRRHDRRRELILGLNFALPLVERGEVKGANRVSKRSVEIARAEGGERLALALLIRGRVLAEAVGDRKAAVAAVEEAVESLKALGEHGRALAEAWVELLAPCAELALAAERVDVAEAVLRLVEPDVELPRRSTPPPTDELLAESNGELDGPLAAWRASTGSKTGDGSLARVARFAELLGWTDVAARLERGTAVADSAAASASGPAGFVRLGELVAAGEIDHDDARSAAGSLGIADDDLAFVSLWALSHEQLSESGAGFAVAALSMEVSGDPLLAARLGEALSIFAQRGDAALRYLDTAIERLGAGVDDTYRAHLLNESAVKSGATGRFEESLERARAARELATSVDADEVARMSLGNVGWVLMQLGRNDEALVAFEQLEREQLAAGDTDGVEQTRYNLRATRVALGQADEVAFTGDSSDPDEVFGKAVAVAGTGDTFRAAKLFERLFQLVEQKETAFGHEAEARAEYARVLYTAGRTAPALAQLEEALAAFERDGKQGQAFDTLVALAELHYGEPARARPYARRSRELAEALGDPERRARAERVAGRVELADGEFDGAVEALAAAVELGAADARPDLAQALLGAGRIDDSAALAAVLLGDARAGGEPRGIVRALMALAEARDAAGRASTALELLAEAHSLAVTLPPDDVLLEAMGRYGYALVRGGRPAHAAAVLEDALGRTQPETRGGRSLRLYQGLALTALGELDAAEAVLGRLGNDLRAIGDDAALMRALLAAAAVSMARHDTQGALTRYQEGERLAGELGDANMRATALDSIGVLYDEQGTPGRAVEYHREAADVHVRLGRLSDAFSDLLHLTQSLVVVGDGVGAAAALAEARRVREQLDGAPDTTLDFVAARVAAANDEWAEARAGFRAAIERMERERDRFEAPSALRRARGRDSHVYDIAAAAAIDAGDGEAALVFAEARRARFLEDVARLRSARPPGVDAAAWLAFGRTADEVSNLRARRRATGSDELDKAIADVERRHAEAAEAVGAQVPGGVAESRRLPKVDDLVDALGPGTAAVLLDVTRSGLEVVCVGRDAAGLVQIRARRDPDFVTADLERLFFGDREALEAGGADAPADAYGWILGRVVQAEAEELALWSAVVADTCRVLGRRIWPAVLELLPDGCERVVLLPSAGLNVLPLHAAVLGDGRRACDRFRVSFAPSLRLLKASDEAGPITTLVLGQAVPRADDLPFAPLEAEEVARDHPGDVVRRVDAEAGAGAVLDLLADCDAVHFAGHALYDPADPLASHLACTPSEGSDGRLTVASILWAERPVRARLVVLSACDSGRVEEVDRMDDFVGLAGGLLVGGARAVLATYWEVDDLVASLLVDRFFAAWDGGARAPAEALADAQRWLRQELTVGEVQDRLVEWADRTDDERVQELAAAWESREDTAARAFPDEVDWAPFHLVGSSWNPNQGGRAKWRDRRSPPSGPLSSAW